MRDQILAGALLLLSGAGCASSNGLGAPVAHFPSRTELEQIAERPATPEEPFEALSVEHWQLAVTAPASGSPYPQSSPWDEQLLAITRAQPALQLSAELRCAAFETARFYVEQGAFPDGVLRAYMIARCGSSLPQTNVQTLSFQVDDGRPEAQIAAQVAQRVKQGFASWASGSVGLGFARGKGRAAIVSYRGVPRVELKQFAPIVAGEEFEIGGRLLEGAASATALVTIGRYGVGQCAPDRHVQSPSFRFTCPMAKEDEQAVVQMVTRREDRLLGEPVLRALLLRSPGAGESYTANFAELGARAAPSGTSPSGGFQDSLLTALNRIRHAAHFEPLLLEDRQSRFNERLAPQFFAATFADDGARADLVALGVLAGWDVGGMIRTGGVYSGEEETFDGARWLGMALKDPIGRAMFLNPDMSRIAIGTLARKQAGVMALVSTYGLFDSPDNALEEDALFDDLVNQRTALGLPPPLRRARGKELTLALQKIAQRKLTSGQALQQALNDVASRTQLRMQGLVVETSDISLIRLPEELLSPGELDIAIGVAHYKPEGGAWGQYAVLYLFTKNVPQDRRARHELHPPARDAGSSARSSIGSDPRARGRHPGPAGSHG